MNSSLKQISHCKLLQGLHSKSFAWTCLPISENCNCSGVEHKIKDGSHTKVIELLICLIVVKCVVEFKLLVFNKFSYAVNFEFILMHKYIRVTERNAIYFPIFQFLLKDWSLFYAYTNFQLVCWDMLNTKSQRSSIYLLVLQTERFIFLTLPKPKNQHQRWFPVRDYCSLVQFVFVWLRPCELFVLLFKSLVSRFHPCRKIS